ncbi:hypothetical protein LINPERPRIM_LOCUS5571 [Linum perenne]
MDSLCKNGLVSKGLDVFSKMKDRNCPSDVVTIVLIHGLCVSNRRKEAILLLDEMSERN